MSRGNVPPSRPGRGLRRELILVAALLAGSAAAAPTPVERHGSTYEVRFAPEHVELRESALGMHVSLAPVSDAPREPGAPSLPFVPVVIEIPHDMTAVSIEVETEETVVAKSVEIAAAMLPGQGNEPPREAPRRDDLFAGIYPRELARLSGEGFARGHRLLTVELAPLSWNPATGELKLATLIRFRLGLEPAEDRPLERQRTIPHVEARYERALAAAIGAPKPPAVLGRQPAAATPFVPTFSPSTDGSPVEYVILTNDAMAPEFQVLADWRTQMGLQSVVRTIEWVSATYPNGADRAEQIRFFLEDAYRSWGTLWVLLGGDTDIIPARFVASVVQTQPENPHYLPCDLYYACLDNNWNADGDDRVGEGWRTNEDPGDGADLDPELYVGRAPVSSPTEAEVFVQKLLDYERTPPVDPDYPASILFLAEHLGFEDGAVFAEQAVAQVHPWMRMVRLYETFETYPGSLPLGRRAALDSITSGFGWVHHVGHGYRNTMSVGDGAINNADADGLENGDRQSFVFAINCSSASIDFNAIAERWLKNPGGGAVGYVGTSRLAFPSVSVRYQNEFYRLAFADSIDTAGECLFMSRLPWVANAFFENFDRWTQLTLLLLGDPALPLWTNTPAPLTASHADSLSLGAGSFSLTAQNETSPVPEARVAFLKISEDFKTGFTDAGGQITLPFNPRTTGTFQATVTRRNFLPYAAEIPVRPSSPPFLIVDQVLVDDDNTGSSLGNGDGVVDAGETIEIAITVENRGSLPASAITGNLVAVTGGEHLELLTAAQVYGGLNPGQSASGTFVVRFLPSSPHGFQPLFRLDITASEGSWSDVFVLPVHTAAIEHRSHEWSDPPPTGNNNGLVEPGESILYSVELRNGGVGEAESVAAKLRVINSSSSLPDPLVTVTDSTHAYGNLLPGAGGSGGFAFDLDPAANPEELRLELTVTGRWDTLGVYLTDLSPPGTVDSLRAFGSDVAITLKWAPSASPDVLGYDVFRSDSPGGPFARINDQTVIGNAFFEDFPLPSLTRRYYRIAARDSSQNQSELSDIFFGITTPPLHSGWPIAVPQSTTSGPKTADIVPGDDLELVLGANCIYAWHASGQEVRDGDDDPRTSGVFTTDGCDPLNGFRSDAALADLDADGEIEIIMTGWGGSGPGALHVLEPDGSRRDGWPRTLNQGFNWASPAVGQVLGDPDLDIVVMQGESGVVYAFHADGDELIDGDSNPATIGPLFVTGSRYAYGSPGLGDLDSDALDEIVVVQNEPPGYVWAVNGDGTLVPGWPFATGDQITSSPAIFDLDGNGVPEVVVSSEIDSVYVLRANGTVYPGWPRFASVSTITGRTSSPVVADIDRNGILDILLVDNDGQIHIWDRDGNPLAAWQNVFFAQESVDQGVTEATPTVGDIDGDGEMEILIGAEDGRLYAFNHDATEVLGFPIQFEGEIRSSATIWDIDGDGLVEIALSGWDQNIYVWDMEGAFNPSLVPWPFFRHDLLNRGNPETPVEIGVGDPGAVLPLSYRLGEPRPNPFNPWTEIDFDVPGTGISAPVELRIYDVAGRLLRTLVDGPMEAGRHTLTWDGRDQRGSMLGSGIYLLRGRSPGFAGTRKLILIR